MPVIAVCNPKGGTGKTTVSLNLAVMLQQRDYQIALMDLDPQASISQCVKQRPRALPALVCQKYSTEQAAQVLFERDGDRVYVLDCPAAFSESDLTHLMAYLDVLIIPSNTSRLDFNALVPFLFEINRVSEVSGKSPAMALIANRVRSRVRLYQDILGWFHKLSLPTVMELRDTVNYSLSAYHGLGVTELPPAKAQSDIAQWQGLYTWLKPYL